jgi:hypothetical protein
MFAGTFARLSQSSRPAARGLQRQRARSSSLLGRQSAERGLRTMLNDGSGAKGRLPTLGDALGEHIDADSECLVGRTRVIILGGWRPVTGGGVASRVG